MSNQKTSPPEEHVLRGSRAGAELTAGLVVRRDGGRVLLAGREVLPPAGTSAEDCEAALRCAVAEVVLSSVRGALVGVGALSREAVVRDAERVRRGRS